MKLIQPIAALLLAAVSFHAVAQTKIPDGYQKGSIVLADNSTVSGFIKENMKSNASICMLNEKGENKTSYDANALQSVTIGDASYITIKGDFFKLVTSGNTLSFLQKSSNISSGPVYNGTEVIYFAGTEGKAGDYFIFNKKSTDLKRVTKKTFEAVVAESFAGCTPALEKAHAISNDIPQLKDAVDIFNSNTK